MYRNNPFFMRWRRAEWPITDEKTQPYVGIQGINGLPERHWYDPRWRWQWPSRFLVLDPPWDFETDAGFHVYFKEGDCCMTTRWPVDTKAITVRIGPRDVLFCAQSELGMIVPLEMPLAACEWITPI